MVIYDTPLQKCQKELNALQDQITGQAATIRKLEEELQQPQTSLENKQLQEVKATLIEEQKKVFTLQAENSNFNVLNQELEKKYDEVLKTYHTEKAKWQKFEQQVIDLSHRLQELSD